MSILAATPAWWRPFARGRFYRDQIYRLEREVESMQRRIELLSAMDANITKRHEAMVDALFKPAHPSKFVDPTVSPYIREAERRINVPPPMPTRIDRTYQESPSSSNSSIATHLASAAAGAVAGAALTHVLSNSENNYEAGNATSYEESGQESYEERNYD